MTREIQREVNILLAFVSIIAAFVLAGVATGLAYVSVGIGRVGEFVGEVAYGLAKGCLRISAASRKLMEDSTT